MLKPLSMACDTIEVYAPEHFVIHRVDGGFEVSSKHGALLGVAATFPAARDLMSDGTHEQLCAVHDM